jgi:hypothetical protein
VQPRTPLRGVEVGGRPATDVVARHRSTQLALWTSTLTSTQMSTPLVRVSFSRVRLGDGHRSQSSQGRRSRGAGRVGRRALTARTPTVDTMDFAGRESAGLLATNTLDARILCPRCDVGGIGGRSAEQCKCVYRSTPTVDGMAKVTHHDGSGFDQSTCGESCGGGG